MLSAFLFAAPVGVLIGGWVADRSARHDRIAVLSFVAMGGVFAVVAMTRLPLALLAVLFAAGGLASGLVAPSRDMMIRALAPPGEIGKVFGFVSSGFNIGGVFAPVCFGYLLDQTAPDSRFWAVSVASLLTVATVLLASRPARR